MLTRVAWFRPAAAQSEVLAEIDVGHAAAADLAQHAVAAAHHLFWLEHVTHVWLPRSIADRYGSGRRPPAPSGQGRLRQSRLDHGGGERRRRLAAGRLGVFDDDGDRDFRVVRRGEGDEPRQVCLLYTSDAADD